MIRVTLPRAPAHYFPLVKTPGEAFLKITPSPAAAEWQANRYWRAIHDDLYAGHNGICVYSASWTPRRRASGLIDYTSIDHYVPKAADPSKAYEWGNFRLCRSRLNHNKDQHRDVLDPCAITDGWFVLDFTTFLIRPAAGLESGIEAAVRSTIARLRLNADNDYVNERIAVVRDYTLKRIAFTDVSAKYPFIAQQMTNQNFDTSFKPRLVAFFARFP